MREMIITIVVALLGSGGLSALVTGLFSAHQAKKRKNSGLTSAVRILLYDRIKHLGRAYLERGYVYADELEDLIQMHGIYHDGLAGNGFLDSVMTAVKNLPIKEVKKYG